MNERKQFIREYIEARGGDVKELSEDEKKALRELARKDEKDAD